jgi:NADPH2:quinone reductase
MDRIPVSMQAIEISEPGGPDVLRLVERPVPRAAASEVLVHVAAAGVNRPDIMQRLGKYPPPPGASDIPGLEIAGTIVDLGPKADLIPGSHVCALVSGGGYAEYCVVPQQQCLPIPEGLSHIEAAAIPETFFTVWTNLFDRGGLRQGEVALIHGAAGGIGTTALQLGRAFGATMVATAGSDEKCAACRRLGAAYAINYNTDDFVGGDYLPRNLECLRLNGRLIQIGLMGGAQASLNLRFVLQKRLTITGSTLRARTPDEKGAIARAVHKAVWPLFASGAVRPLVHATVPLAEAARAHEALEAGQVIGKVVLIT